MRMREISMCPCGSLKHGIKCIFPNNCLEGILMALLLLHNGDASNFKSVTLQETKKHPCGSILCSNNLKNKHIFRCRFR